MPDMFALYGATPFDENDPLDRMAEQARQTMLTAALSSLAHIDARNGEQLQSVAGGLLVGLVCVVGSMAETTDENHAAMRAGLLQLVPWAIDMMRSMEGLGPLPTDVQLGVKLELGEDMALKYPSAYRSPTYVINTVVGTYVIEPRGQHHFQWFLSGKTSGRICDEASDGLNFCQADYEARIRSALTVQPAPDVAALVEAAKAISKARLTLDTEFKQMGETVDYSGTTIDFILGMLDRALSALAKLEGLS